MDAVNQQLLQFKRFLDRNAQIYDELISPTTRQPYNVSARIELRPSSHGGLGVFARESIKKGEVALYYVGTYAHHTHVKSQDAANRYRSHSINPGFEHPSVRSGMITDGRSYAYYNVHRPNNSSEHLWASGAMMNSSMRQPSMTNVDVVKGPVTPSPVISALRGPLPVFHIELDNPNAPNHLSFGYVLSAVIADRNITPGEELMFAYHYESNYNPTQLSILTPPVPSTPSTSSSTTRKRMSLDDLLASKVKRVDLEYENGTYGRTLAFPTIGDLGDL